MGRGLVGEDKFIGTEKYREIEELRKQISSLQDKLSKLETELEKNREDFFAKMLVVHSTSHNNLTFINRKAIPQYENEECMYCQRAYWKAKGDAIDWHCMNCGVKGKLGFAYDDEEGSLLLCDTCKQAVGYFRHAIRTNKPVKPTYGGKEIKQALIDLVLRLTPGELKFKESKEPKQKLRN